MKTNYDVIEKVTYECEITIVDVEDKIWTIMFPEAYDEKSIDVFADTLLKNGIKVEKTDDNVLIYEEVI